MDPERGFLQTQHCLQPRAATALLRAAASQLARGVTQLSRRCIRSAWTAAARSIHARWRRPYLKRCALAPSECARSSVIYKLPGCRLLGPACTCGLMRACPTCLREEEQLAHTGNCAIRSVTVTAAAVDKQAARRAAGGQAVGVVHRRARRKPAAAARHPVLHAARPRPRARLGAGTCAQAALLR